MGVANKLIGYIDGIFIITMVLFGILILLYYYFFKIKKIAAKEERINHDNFDKHSSMDYVPFDELFVDGDDLGSNGVVDMGGGIFVAGLDVVGYNYHAASAEERQRTMINSIALMNTIESPVQFRQSVKAVDLSANIELHEGYLVEISKAHMVAHEEYQALMAECEDNIDNLEVLEYLDKQVLALQRKIKTLEWQSKECQTLIEFMKRMSDREKDAQKVNQMLFTYRFNPDDYTEELTREEVCQRAIEELRTLAASYKSSLEACGCRVTRMTGVDLIGAIRRHFAPITADDITVDELVDSSYTSLFTTSDSLRELQRMKLGEQEFARIMEQQNREREELLHRQEVDRKRNETMILTELGEGAV